MSRVSGVGVFFFFWDSEPKKKKKGRRRERERCVCAVLLVQSKRLPLKATSLIAVEKGTRGGGFGYSGAFPGVVR